MWTTSRKPRVLTRPAVAPSCSSTVLVATVVPWKTASSAAGSWPPCAQSSFRPATIAWPGSSGVERTLWTCTDPDSMAESQPGAQAFHLGDLLEHRARAGDRHAGRDQRADRLERPVAALRQRPRPRARLAEREEAAQLDPEAVLARHLDEHRDE